MEEEKNNGVLEFPIQIKDWDAPMTDKELVTQARFFAAKALNQVATGQIKELPDRIKRRINGVNMLCRRMGITPLETDF